MGKRVSTDSTPVLALKTEYSTPYSAIIRDDIVMGVPRYFLERWVPVLGASSAALVNTLRQLDYRYQGDTIIISGETLAQEAGMSRRHLYKCLETPWINAFVRQESGQKHRAEDGTITQQANRYRVRMDDPLSPADAESLLDVLVNLADDPLTAVQAALERDPRDLWAADAKASPLRFTDPRALTARDVLRRAFPTWKAPNPEAAQSFAKMADALHRHFVLTREDGRTSKIIVPQYFRRQWWSKLGHDLAWSYLWLRGQVYENANDGIRRDTCWIPALDTILNLIGRPREWWRRNVENASDKEGWKLGDFFAQIDSQKGRDPAHSQWVARQFIVSLEIPIAPEDRVTYEDLLATWTSEGIAPPAMSATFIHTGSPEVRHIRTHRHTEGLPHSCTPASPESATLMHTGLSEVCHIHAQASATSVHRNTESKNSPVHEKTESASTNKQVSVKPSRISNPLQEAGAAAKPEFSEITSMGKVTKNPSPTENLVDQIAAKLANEPETPLYRCAAPITWLSQVWPEPVQPHTPAWDRVISGALSPQDLVALILAVWVDTSIKHPPRYLSWLVQRWDAQPDSPPVLHWDTWRTLAEMPVGEWMDAGRRLWIGHVPTERCALPFGLEFLSTEFSREIDSVEISPDKPPVEPILQPDAVLVDAASDGLDELLNGGALTVRDIWQATLGQLSLQLNTATYANWVKGARPIAFSDGVLTVEARHRTAWDWLTHRLNHTIERTASSLAGVPISIRYQYPKRLSRS